MRCRYEFFLVSPNNNYSDYYEEDWNDNETYIGVDASGKDDRLCITISGRQTGKSHEYLVNGNDYSGFKGTGVGLHINSVYGIPYIPTQTPRLYGKSMIKTLYDKAKNTQCIQFLKPKPYLKVKPRTTGYPFMSGTIMADLVDRADGDIWGDLAGARKHCAESFKGAVTKMILKDEPPFNNPRPTIILTSTPSKKKGFFYDSIMSANAWNNFNLEANAFGTLPKHSWDYSGWRIFGKKKQCLNFR